MEPKQWQSLPGRIAAALAGARITWSFPDTDALLDDHEEARSTENDPLSGEVHPLPGEGLGEAAGVTPCGTTGTGCQRPVIRGSLTPTILTISTAAASTGPSRNHTSDPLNGNLPNSRGRWAVSCGPIRARGHRITVFGSHPASSAAENAQQVRSNASRISGARSAPRPRPVRVRRPRCFPHP